MKTMPLDSKDSILHCTENNCRRVSWRIINNVQLAYGRSHAGAI